MWYKIKFFVAVITLSLVVNPSHATLLDDSVVLQHYSTNDAVTEGVFDLVEMD